MSYPITEELKYLAEVYESGEHVDISANNIFQRCLDEITSQQAVVDAALAWADCTPDQVTSDLHLVEVIRNYRRTINSEAGEKANEESISAE